MSTLTCTTPIAYGQKLNCTFNISSNMANYLLSITYDDVTVYTMIANDGILNINYTYAYSGSYNLSITIPRINYVITQSIIVLSGFI